MELVWLDLCIYECSVDLFVDYVGGEQQGVCYAFVEFEEPAGAQSAIEVTIIELILPQDGGHNG